MKSRRLTFLKYPAGLEEPLHRDQAARCLDEMVLNIASALISLHGAKLAHLDLRLENICFNSDGSVVLIDLDRYENSEDEARMVYKRGSVMYHYGKGKLRRKEDAFFPFIETMP